MALDPTTLTDAEVAEYKASLEYEHARRNVATLVTDRMRAVLADAKRIGLTKQQAQVLGSRAINAVYDLPETPVNPG